MLQFMLFNKVLYIYIILIVLMCRYFFFRKRRFDDCIL